ncbi:Vanillin dehydrogenase [compost metagenome]
MLHAQLFINNQDVASSDGATFDCLNPVNGEVATVAAAASVDSALAAVNAATVAFGAWAAMLPQQRRALLDRAADLMFALQHAHTMALARQIGATHQAIVAAADNDGVEIAHADFSSTSVVSHWPAWLSYVRSDRSAARSRRVALAILREAVFGSSWMKE